MDETLKESLLAICNGDEQSTRMSGFVQTFLYFQVHVGKAGTVGFLDGAIMECRGFIRAAVMWNLDYAQQHQCIRLADDNDGSDQKDSDTKMLLTLHFYSAFLCKWKPKTVIRWDLRETVDMLGDRHFQTYMFGNGQSYQTNLKNALLLHRLTVPDFELCNRSVGVATLSRGNAWSGGNLSAHRSAYSLVTSVSLTGLRFMSRSDPYVGTCLFGKPSFAEVSTPERMTCHQVNLVAGEVPSTVEASVSIIPFIPTTPGAFVAGGHAFSVMAAAYSSAFTRQGVNELEHERSWEQALWWQSHTSASDTDLFICATVCDAQRTAILEHTIREYTEGVLEKCGADSVSSFVYVQTKLCLNVVPVFVKGSNSSPPPFLQAILIRYNSLSHLFSSFDLDCCAFAMNGSVMYGCKRSIDAMVWGNFVRTDTPTWSPRTLSRLKKYAQRGVGGPPSVCARLAPKLKNTVRSNPNLVIGSCQGYGMSTLFTVNTTSPELPKKTLSYTDKRTPVLDLSICDVENVADVNGLQGTCSTIGATISLTLDDCLCGRSTAVLVLEGDDGGEPQRVRGEDRKTSAIEWSEKFPTVGLGETQVDVLF